MAVQVGGVEGVTDLQLLGPAVGEALADGGHGLGVAGDHHRTRAVTAAISAPGTRTSRTSSSVASTATIAPPPGSSCINRARAATSEAASASENTPRHVGRGQLTDRVPGQ
ncbi:hypothetical protein GCM10020229_79440 [Kitasatospora albolonga]